jgi:hypothetical protein
MYENVLTFKKIVFYFENFLFNFIFIIERLTFKKYLKKSLTNKQFLKSTFLAQIFFEQQRTLILKLFSIL